MSSDIGTALQLADDPLGQVRVGERSSAHGDQRRTRSQVLMDIRGGSYATGSDDRHTPGPLHDARHRENTDREKHGTAHATIALPQTCLTIGAEEEPRQRVHRAHRVSPGISCNESDCGDVGKRRRQFCDEGKPGSRPARRDDAPNAGGICSELDATGTGIGTGEIQLEGRDSWNTLQPADHLTVFLYGEPDHVDQNSSPGQAIRQPRQVLLPDSLDTGVGEAHRVEHAAGKLPDPRGRIPRPWFQRDRLGHQPTEAVEVEHSVELSTETGCTSGEKERILESPAQQLAGEVETPHYCTGTLDVPGAGGRRVGSSVSSRTSGVWRTHAAGRFIAGGRFTPGGRFTASVAA